MKEKIIVLDETEGKSKKGAMLKRMAKNRGFVYVTNIEDCVKEQEKDE